MSRIPAFVLLRRPRRVLLSTLCLLLLSVPVAHASNEGPAELLPGPEGPVLHVPFCPVPCGSLQPALGGVPSHLTPLGDRLFYSAGDEDHGFEPWISDGTVAGTAMLTDLCPGDCSSEPVPLAVVPPAGVAGLPAEGAGPRLVFLAWSPDHGREPWVTDGTAGGTFLLRDFCPGECGFQGIGVSPWEDLLDLPWLDAGEVLVVASAQGGEVVFSARTEAEVALFATDGTSAGTRRVTGICDVEEQAGFCFETFWFGRSGDGRVYFVEQRRLGATDLWRTDGTAEGTERVPLPCPAGARAAVQSEPIPFGDGVAFLAACFEPGTRGTTSLFSLRGDGPPVDLGVDDVVDLAVAGDRLFAVRGIPGEADPAPELWVSDGTPTGTRRALELDFHPERLEAAVDRLFLFDRETGGLFTTDGTTPPVQRNEAPVPEPGRFSEVAGRALWWERPVREQPEIYEWWLVSFHPETGRKREQVFVAPVIAPGEEFRVADVPPTHQRVGDELFLRAQAGTGNQLWHMATAEIGPECLDRPEAQCLREGRFQVTVRFRNQHAGGAEGTATPDAGSRSLQGDTGFFWFFRPDNLELAVKVLDGRPVNGHWWVFSGGTTNLEYDLEVRDLVSGELRTYRHPPGDLCSVVDTAAFSEAPGVGSSFAPTAAPRAASSPPSVAGAPLTPPLEPECDWYADRLACVGPDDRFSIRVDYTNPHAGGATGEGFAFPETADTAVVRFFPNGGVEAMVKVLDGRPVNGHWWVLWGGLTNLGYTVRVLDRQSEEVRIFTNPPGSQCGGADTSAFAETP